MTTTSPDISGGERSRTLLSLLVTLAALMIGVAGAPTARDATAAGGEYPWPVKPFDKAHPVRGNFGDPRTIFSAEPSREGLMTGAGRFSFHFGVDIWAPNGTAVYPVVDGTVRRVSRAKGREYVEVVSGGGRSFQYWHIDGGVQSGQAVRASQTPLGTILAPAQHVHLAEFQGARPVNPLAPGHLRGYADSAAPVVEAISLRGSDTSPALVPSFVHGRVVMVAEAYDTRELPIPGIWRSMPVTPALLTWRLVSIGGVVAARGTAADFRDSIPSGDLFWSTYARGTHQNMSVFGSHYSWGQPGSFQFRLTRSSFDTAKLGDGVYDLVVTATDIRGNTSSKALRLTVENQAGR